MSALLLVFGVIVVLLGTMSVIRSRSMDTAQSGDSAAALALAESGLERAQSVVSTAVAANTATNTTCTGLPGSGTFAVGRGSFSYSAAVSTPATCGTSSTPCTGCALTAKGVVGSAERDLSLDVEYGIRNGTAGRGSVVTMVLKNTFNQDAYAMFDLSWRRQGQGGNASGTSSTCASCTLIWNLESSSGNPSVGSIGTAVPIAANTVSQVVTQTLSQSRDYVEVGALFPGVSGSPTLLAAYWSDNGTMETKANQQSAATGATNSGVAASDTSTACLKGATVPNPPGSNTSQSCNSWCYGGDTLVYGFSGRATTVADQLTAVTFNTAGSNGYTAQNLAMTQIVHFPNTDGSISAASGKLYSEGWYYYNPVYNSTTTVTSGSGAGATSYTAAVVGAAGATLSFPNSSKIGNHSNNGTFTSVTGYAACVGDTIVDSNLPSATTITSLKQHVGGTAVTCVSAGTVNIDIVVSNNATGNVTNPTITSTSLHTTANTGTLAAGSATVLAGGTITIASGPDGSGVYTLSSPATVTSGYVVQGTGLGTTIKVPSSADLPATTGTIVNIYSKSTSPTGQGALAAQTTVTAIDTTNLNFTISAAPTTAIIGATLCGGTCALFNEPSSLTASTSFLLAKSSGTTQWSSGFLCLSGVDRPNIIPVTSTTILSRTWSEGIQ